MYWNLVSAKYLDGYRLAVTFEDGKSGVVDLEQRLRKQTVFERLLDVEVFKGFHIHPEFGVLCWGKDLDLAPETLYEAAVGRPSPAQIAEARAKYGRKPRRPSR